MRARIPVVSMCMTPMSMTSRSSRAKERVRRLLVIVAVLVVALTSSACPEPMNDGGVPDGGISGCLPFVVGDLLQPLEIEAVLRTASGDQVDAVPYGPVELFRPPQGGKVFLVGARVKNVDTCGLRITASLRDPCDGRVLALEGRPFRTFVTDAGYAEPINPRSLSNYANVPACPRAVASRDVNDGVYEMTVVVEALDGRNASVTLPVVPTCVQPGALGQQCECECERGYVLGEECEVSDAGSSGPPLDDAGVPMLVCE